MKHLLTLLSFVVIWLPLSGQSLEATYEEKKVFTEEGLKGVDPFVRDLLKNTESVSFKLKYSKGTSIYEVLNEKKEQEITLDGNVKVIHNNDYHNNYVMYKDQNNRQMVNQTSIFNRIFLVKDKLHSFDWIITDQTQKIGEYTCRMATTHALYDSTTKVIAWFTDDIPINDGPKEFWGLPGLIIRAEMVNPHGNKYVVAATKISFENENIDLIAPSKGKVVDRETFIATLQDKSKISNTGSPFEN